MDVFVFLHVIIFWVEEVLHLILPFVLIFLGIRNGLCLPCLGLVCLISVQIVFIPSFSWSYIAFVTVRYPTTIPPPIPHPTPPQFCSPKPIPFAPQPSHTLTASSHKPTTPSHKPVSYSDRLRRKPISPLSHSRSPCPIALWSRDLVRDPGLMRGVEILMSVEGCWCLELWL